MVNGRLKDSEILCERNRFDGSVYLCGYAVELALKYRICKSLNWKEFHGESKALNSFKTHNLDTLLLLSGVERKIKRYNISEWSVVVDKWSEENRYKPIGTMTRQDAKDMIESTKKLINKLC